MCRRPYNCLDLSTSCRVRVYIVLVSVDKLYVYVFKMDHLICIHIEPPRLLPLCCRHFPILCLFMPTLYIYVLFFCYYENVELVAKLIGILLFRDNDKAFRLPLANCVCLSVCLYVCMCVCVYVCMCVRSDVNRLSSSLFPSLLLPARHHLFCSHRADRTVVCHAK